MIHSRAFPCGLREFNRDASCAMQLGGQPHIGITRACFHRLNVVRLPQRAGITPARVRLAATAAATTATDTQPEQAAAAYIARSLEQLQYCVANLDTDVSADGLLTAYQQLQHIQRQLLQELRSCQAAIHRAKWRAAASNRRSSRASSRVGSNAASATASQQEEEQPASSQQQPQHCLQDSEEESVQLAQLRQLRLKCDDAQDYLVGLMQGYLQEEPPASATRLLTLAASRQLNIAALNRTCVQAFLDKQQDSTLADMTGLMAALALVRCCSKHRQQVEGLDQHELAALFSGIMTHLLAHVERTMSNQQQQQHQAAAVQAASSCGSDASTPRSRTRRTAAAAAAGCDVTVTQPAAAEAAAAAQQHEVSTDCAEELRRQVAAGVAAHVSGRVPLASALIPHILHILGEESPSWLHPITDVQAATTVNELRSMISHPGRYDYTYLATALHRLSELTEQQQLAAAATPAVDDTTLDTQVAAAAGAAARAELVQGSRLAKKLYGRLQQLAQDATAAELACVLQATCRMGTAAGEVYAVPALQFAQGPQLQQATETQIASVMYSVALYSSSISSGSFSGSSTGSGRNDGAVASAGFSKQQQQVVLKACAQQVCNLVQQQQQLQTVPVQNTRTAAAAAAALIEPSTALMAVWALATSNVQIPKAITRCLFEYIAQPNSLQKLIGAPGGSSSGSKAVQQQHPPLWEDVARNSCTILWAAAQLQYLQPDMALVKACSASFMQAMPAIHVACSSVVTVLQSLASLLAAQQQQQQARTSSQQVSRQVAVALQQQQQQEQQHKASGSESDHWKSIFLRCSDEVVQRLLQQQQRQLESLADSSISSAGQQQAVHLAAALPGQQQQQQGCTGATAAADAIGPTAVIVDSVCPVTAACQVVWAYQVAGCTLPDRHVVPLVQLLGSQAPCWLLRTALTQAKSAHVLLELLQSPAAAAADLSCVASALQQLLQLQQQAVLAVQQQQQEEAAVQMKELDRIVKQCCQQISRLATQIPTLQQDTQQQQQQQQPAVIKQQQQQQDTAASQAATGEAQTAAAAAATVIWATAQLQHKDSWLSGTCLRAFHAAVEAASAADAAAVVAAMASPGRLLQKVFAGCSIDLLQEVLRCCTAKVLSTTGTLAAQAAEQAVQLHGGSSSSSSSKPKMRRRSRTNTSTTSSSSNSSSSDLMAWHEAAAESQGGLLVPGIVKSVTLAQQLLQLHAVLRLQPTPQQLQLLLQAATDDAALKMMDDKAATAALVAVLAAVAELSTLQQGNTMPASAPPVKVGKLGKGKAGRGGSSLWQQPLVQRGQQLQVQQLLQELLLYGLLPRVRRATAKQVATALEAAAALTAHSTTSTVNTANAAAAVPGSNSTPSPLLSVELCLARDFARGVFQEVMASPSADAAGTAAAADADVGVKSFLIGWKGEHVSTVTTAALKLGVPCSSFFEAVAADVLTETQRAAAADSAGKVQQQQLQRRRSLIEKLQLQHLVVVCCCAAALHCRVEQLLVHTCTLLTQQLQQQQQQQGQAHQRRQQQQQQSDPVQVLLLAWSAAVMDVPQLLQPAQALAIASVAAMRAAAHTTSSHGSGGSALDQADSNIAASWLQHIPTFAARLFQLHIWLSDRQLQQEQEQEQHASVAAAFGSNAANSASSSSSSKIGIDTAPTVAPLQATAQLGLTGALSAEELQLASSIWSQLQLQAPGAACRQQQLKAVAAALQQLPGVEQLQLQSTTSDGCLVVDLEARVRAIPVAVLVLDDFEGGAVRDDDADGRLDLQQNRGLAAAAGVSSRPSSSRNNSSMLLECLGKAHIGDVMFRARALAACGYLVVVISWQQWTELEGRLDAELQYLLGKLWLLQDEVQVVKFAEEVGVQTENPGVEEGMFSGGAWSRFVTGMPVTAAATASLADEEGLSEDISNSSNS